jgi:hypothetical protein
LKTGALALTRDLLRLELTMKKLIKNQQMHFQWLLLVAILGQWQHLLASNKVLNLLYWAMCAELYRHTAMAIKMASKEGAFVDCCLFVCCPGSRWGNTEKVVTRWRHPVASWIALDMPHRAMLSYCSGAPQWP